MKGGLFGEMRSEEVVEVGEVEEMRCVKVGEMKSREMRGGKVKKIRKK